MYDSQDWLQHPHNPEQDKLEVNEWISADKDKLASKLSVEGCFIPIRCLWQDKYDFLFL